MYFKILNATIIDVSYAAVIFADGDLNLISAGNRLRSQLLKTGLFKYVFVFDSLKLSLWDTKYRELNSSGFTSNRGHGFWVWKPIILKTLLDNYDETEIQSLVYLDAGCEVINSFLSKRKFKQLLEESRKDYRRGVLAFPSKYLEINFCKKELLNKLAIPKSLIHQRQMSAGWFFIVNNRYGYEFIDRWYYYATLDNCFFITDDNDVKIQHIEFIEHRHDQAIFSLVFKTMELIPYEIDYRKQFGTIRNSVIPVWTSRNKSGKSVVKRRAHLSITYICGRFINFVVDSFKFRNN